ncbi:MAG: FMN-dependent NADH-azoreductase [Paracoccaceae bacterium]
MTRTVLRIDASMRREGSVTRALADRIVAKLGPDRMIARDLADGVPLVDEAWIGANFTLAEDRTDAQRAALSVSDALIEELRAADTLVIGLPVYNFGVPAALKAWIDQVARARVTFRYTESGPVGLLTGKRAIVVVASGGTEVDSGIDFATPYLRHALGFIGINDIRVVKADRQMMREDATEEAQAEIDALAA